MLRFKDKQKVIAGVLAQELGSLSEPRCIDMPHLDQDELLSSCNQIEQGKP